MPGQVACGDVFCQFEGSVERIDNTACQGNRQNHSQKGRCNNNGQQYIDAVVVHVGGIFSRAHGFFSVVPTQGGEFFLIGIGALNLFCISKGNSFLMIGTVQGDDLFHAVYVGPHLAVGVFELRTVGFARNQIFPIKLAVRPERLYRFPGFGFCCAVHGRIGTGEHPDAFQTSVKQGDLNVVDDLNAGQRVFFDVLLGRAQMVYLHVGESSEANQQQGNNAKKQGCPA